MSPEPKDYLEKASIDWELIVLMKSNEYMPYEVCVSTVSSMLKNCESKACYRQTFFDLRGFKKNHKLQPTYWTKNKALRILHIVPGHDTFK